MVEGIYSTEFMSLKLSKKEKEEIAKKIDSGIWDANSPEVKQLIATRHREEPLLFAGQFLSEHFKDQSTGETTPSAEFHREIIGMYKGGDRIGVAAPRGHAKSTVTSFVYVLHSILYEKRKNVVIISASEDMAKRFLRRIREELEHNKKILWIFGRQETDKWSETELRLKNGGVIHAKGRGAQLRGLIDGARRPDLIILDDIEDEELVRSDLRRYDLESWFNGTVLPTLEPKVGQCILIGTILHEDSLLNRVVGGELYPDFETVRYAAVGEDEKPIWPERFTKEKLQAVKRSYMARGQLPQYHMEYMNDPMPQETAVFRSEYFHYYNQIPESTPDKSYLVECYVDLGGGSVKSRADYTAMIVVATDYKNDIYILDYVMEKMGVDTSKMISAMFKLWTKYKPQKYVIEKTVAANMLKSSLEAEMRKQSIYFPVEYITPPKGTGGRRGNMSDAKYQRIGAMESAMKMGVIKMKKWMVELQEQLLSFPRGRHDDLIDALGYAYQMVQRRIVRVVDRAFYEEEEEDFVPLYPEIGL